MVMSLNFSKCLTNGYEDNTGRHAYNREQKVRRKGLDGPVNCLQYQLAAFVFWVSFWSQMWER